MEPTASRRLTRCDQLIFAQQFDILHDGLRDRVGLTSWLQHYHLNGCQLLGSPRCSVNDDCWALCCLAALRLDLAGVVAGGDAAEVFQLGEEALDQVGDQNDDKRVESGHTALPWCAVLDPNAAYALNREDQPERQEHQCLRLCQQVPIAHRD